MKYPLLRLRRLRENPQIRRLVTEERLSVDHLIQPLFVKEGLSRSVGISSMPGQAQHSEKDILTQAKKIEAAGIPGIILFGIPSSKDLAGKKAFSGNGIIQRAVRRIKKQCPQLLVVTDVCLCEYMIHGHCGHVKKGRVQNDASVVTLAKVALSHAMAGADVVAPSDMMDGRVLAIRKLLDRRGFNSIPILSYAVKYASAFYAPFRNAAESAPGFGDRSSYQMNFANRREALREAKADLEEGADMLLVKPALGYTDILHEISQKFTCPIGCFSVSGEYAMIKAAAREKWIDERKIVMETHLGMKRAGAAFILTYWAMDIAKWLRK